MFKLLKGILLATTVGAALATSMAMPALAVGEHPAQVLVEKSVHDLLEVMRTDSDRIRSDPEFLLVKLNEIVVPHLDFLSMTKLSIGKHWRRASDAQKEELAVEFKRFLLNTYTSAVNEYKGGKVKFAPFRAESREDRAVVRSTFEQAGNDSVPVIYKLRDKDGWKIYDIEVSQLSLVTNYRSSFASEIEKNGIDGLISLLKERSSKKN